MDTDTVNPIEEQIEAVQDQVDDAQDSAQEDTRVPLAALRKERLKRQELEIENRLLREHSQRKEVPEEPDQSQYESATKADLGNAQRNVIRQVEENIWKKQNPDKYEKVNELLPEFLKRRPNLAPAIEHATNRYEEAWELMNALTPREQQKLKVAPVKKEAPGNPSGSPKAAALNEAQDVMSMSDAEFANWRRSKRQNR